MKKLMLNSVVKLIASLHMTKKISSTKQFINSDSKSKLKSFCKNTIFSAVNMIILILCLGCISAQAQSEWPYVGHANHVVSMTSLDDKLWAADVQDQLWVRPANNIEVNWQRVGHSINTVALTSLNGILWGATSDDQLWYRAAVEREINWTWAGHANNVVAMASANGQLWAADDKNRLWVRDPKKSNIEWQLVGHANNTVEMASGNGFIYGVDKNGRVWAREAVKNDINWTKIGDVHSALGNTKGLANTRPYSSDSGQLFLATTENILYRAKSLPEFPIAADFGFADKRLPRRTRPLLVILASASDSSAPSVASQSALFFGNGFPSISRAFSLMSNGNFLWTNAGVVQTFSENTWSELNASNHRLHDSQSVAAANPSIDFASFDINRDGVVDTSELHIVKVFAPDPNGVAGRGGQTRPLSAMNLDGVKLNVSISAIGPGGGYSLAMHELLHALGIESHTYGPRGVMNFDATVFASSSGPVYIDPWFRIRAGWVKPKIVSYASGENGAESITIPQMANDTNPPIIFYDANRGKDEFYIAEYRNPIPNSYDSNVFDQGVALWYVKRDSTGRAMQFNWPTPLGRPLTSVANGNMYANFVSMPGPIFGTTFRNRLWDNTDGESNILWPNFVRSELNINVGPMGTNSVVLEWRHSARQRDISLDTTLIRRFKSSSSTSTSITFDGNFNINSDLTAVFTDPVKGSVSSIAFGSAVTIDHSRVTIRGVRVIPPGRYVVKLIHKFGESNGIEIIVDP